MVPKKAALKKGALKKPAAKLDGKKAARHLACVPQPVAKKVTLEMVAAKAKTAVPKKSAAKLPLLFLATTVPAKAGGKATPVKKAA